MLDLKILIIDDDKLVTWSLSRDFNSEGMNPVIAMDGNTGLACFRKETPNLVLLDLKLPDISGLDILKKIKNESPDTIVVMMTAYATVATAVQAIKLGAADFIKKPFTFDELKITLDRALKNYKLNTEIIQMREQIQEKYGIRNLIGKSSSLEQVFSLIRKIAISDATSILLTGESGTGKDLVAKAIHNESNRSQNPFMVINCGSIPDTLLESELFGHEKGAFTDAGEIKQGLFELADEGTVLLDEIAEASTSLQVKLLRFIEDKRFKRIGGTKDIDVNLRIIAATNKNLEDLVARGQFREDLYYRLNVLPIKLAPLRDRPEDILLLVNYFIDIFNKEFNKHFSGISSKAIKALEEYRWSGNVRELKNVIERIMILENDEKIFYKHLTFEIKNKKFRDSFLGDYNLPFTGVSLNEIEKTLVIKALERARGNQSQAAKLLRISRYKLRYKMKKHDLLDK